MPVKHVELVARDQVDIFFHKLLPEEMSSDVQVHPPPGKARGVLNPDAGDFPRDTVHGGRVFESRREELEKSLQCIECACGTLRHNPDTIPTDRQFIPLFSRGAPPGGKRQVYSIPRPLRNRRSVQREDVARRLTEPGRQEPSDILQEGGMSVDGDGGPRTDQEFPRELFDTGRIRHEGKNALCLPGESRRGGVEQDEERSKEEARKFQEAVHCHGSVCCDVGRNVFPISLR